MTIARMLAAISGSKLAASVLFLPDFQPQTSSGFCPEGGVEDTTEQEKLTTVGTVGTSRSVQTHTHTLSEQLIHRIVVCLPSGSS